jgi:exo-beta-1,3-glucanase (GH17 family)
MTRAWRSALSIAAVWLVPASAAAPAQTEPPKLWGLCYGAFRDGQSPGGAHPSRAEIREDLKILRGFTRRIRTYSVSEAEQQIPLLAGRTGIAAYAGAHIDLDAAANAEETERLIRACKAARCAGLVVGNEVLLHEKLLVDQLIEVIRRVKNDPRVVREGMRVGYADTDVVLLAHPELVAELDLLLVNIHPYWAGIPVEEAAEYAVERWRALKSAYPDREVIIGETGWPTAGDPFGDAIPSEANQDLFLESFVPLALERGVPYFFFEAFDEGWKSDASGVEVESHWGLWNSDRTMKGVRFFEEPPPLIGISRVPGCWAGGSQMERIAGRVHGISRAEAASHDVVLYARTNAWYVQPYEVKPLTSIRSNLSWSSRIFLGHAYAAVLVREGCAPSPQLGLLADPNEFPGIPDPGCDGVALAVRECERGASGRVPLIPW